MKNLTFEFNGQLINNPCIDETGRFKVNPIEYYGKDYLNAWSSYKYKEVEKALRNKFKSITIDYDWQDTSWHNDTCMSISAIDIRIKDKEYTIQVFIPNHPISDECEQCNTYAIWIDEEKSYYLNKQGESCFFDNVFYTTEQVTKAISLFIKSQNEK